MSSPITVDALTPAIGAEISGVELSRTLSEPELEAIYQALLEHLVIFFRDQEISPQQHIQFAEYFGALDSPHVHYPHVNGYPNIVELANDGSSPPDTNIWHTDLTFKDEPPFASILVGREIPAMGGDTMWSSLYKAYAALPDAMKSYLAGLDAIHDMGDFRNSYAVGESSGDKLTEAMTAFGCAIHPMIKHHPATGRPYLYVNEAFTRQVVGLNTRDSDRLLQYLFNHMCQPEFQVRFRWRKNSIAMWDNRVTMHYALADYTDSRRMNRITVVNDSRTITEPA